MSASDEHTWVHVCVWDPKHTAAISHAQLNAVRDGTIAKMSEKYKGRPDELKAAMVKAKLVTMVEKAGELHCVECDSLMDKLAAKPGVVGRHLAIDDVASDFDGAIERSRELR